MSSSAQGKQNDDLVLGSSRSVNVNVNADFGPPREILAPEAVVQVSTLSATSFTVLVTNPNTFAENKLFWILNSGSGPDSSFELLEIINNDSPVAKSSDLGTVIPASDGTTHGTKEVGYQHWHKFRDFLQLSRLCKDWRLFLSRGQ